MSDSYTDCKAAIATALAEAEPTAKIYDHFRFPQNRTQDDLESLFGIKENGSTVMRAWQFDRGPIPTMRPIDNGSQVRTKTEQWQIEGYYTLRDEYNGGGNPTAPVFNATLDRVIAYLLRDEAMIALAKQWSAWVIDISVTANTEVLLGGIILCHYASLTVTIQFSKFLPT